MVDLVFKADGGLQVGINGWPDGSVARGSPGKITVDPRAARRNWCFFAVTYDAARASGQLKFFFGGPDARTALDRMVDCGRGPLGARVASALTIGHFAPEARSKPGTEDRMFRGLVNEMRIYGSTRNGTGALALEEIEAARRGGPETGGGRRGSGEERLGR